MTVQGNPFNIAVLIRISSPSDPALMVFGSEFDFTRLVGFQDNLVREATQELDETYYFWSMQFFMEFCRHHSSHVDFIR